MADEGPLRELVKRLGAAGILVAGDVTAVSLEGVDLDSLSKKLLERYKGAPGFNIVNSEELASVLHEIELDKAPAPIEVVRKSDYAPIAADVEADYKISNRVQERVAGTVDDFVAHFRDRLDHLRNIIITSRGGLAGLMANLESTKSYASGREAVVVGLVTNRFETKNGNLMVVIEDDTADAKVIFMNNPSQQGKSLFSTARTIVTDEVIAIKGKISGSFIIASEVLWPDVQIRDRKATEEDVAIAFISDLQVGSKLFLEKNFMQFVKWLNGGVDDQKELAAKVKYVVVAGDIVDGIGVYPHQDRDLAILDIYTQYRIFFNLMGAIPDYIHAFVIPGNHDAVQRAEPQPQLGPELIGDFKSDNVHLLSNPSFMTLHGLDVMAYHGTSLDSMIRAIPGLSYAKPEKAMIEVLKRRHLSPVYGGNIIVPNRHDNLVIDKVPDILHMGHLHRNGLDNYHGVGIVNSGTWQGKTAFQLALGHIPTPGVVPIYETKKRTFTNVNFNSGF